MKLKQVSPALGRDKLGRWLPGQSANPATKLRPGHKWRYQPGQSGNPGATSKLRVAFEAEFYRALMNQGSPTKPHGSYGKPREGKSPGRYRRSFSASRPRTARSSWRLAVDKTKSTSPSSATPNSKPWSELLSELGPLQGLKAERSRRSLRTFIESAWPLVEPVTFVAGWHIDAIAQHLEAVTRGHIQRLLITIPPRHTKSTIVSVMWPCWEWISFPERRWLFASYAESLAIRDNVRSRRPVLSTWYQGNWGERFQFAGDQNQKSKVETDRGGHRIAGGTGGSATGEGGDRLVIDDPHNVADIESDAVRKGTLDWFDTVWGTRANDPRTTAWVIIMQRSHCDDLAGHVLEQGSWEHLCLPSEYENDKRKTIIGWSDPRSKEGELLWPERFGPDQIAEAKRTLGSFAFAGQHEQRPVPASGGVWKRAWFRFYRRADLPEKFDMVMASWDCAFKDLRTSDFVAGQL